MAAELARPYEEFYHQELFTETKPYQNKNLQVILSRFLVNLLSSL